jgi:threonyl-tRNA synthetase
VQESDWKPLETIANQAIKEKQPFERLIMSKPNLLEMFKYNKYKVHFIQEEVPDGTSTTVYRCGPLIDLCVGPHVPHTGRIKAFAILKVCKALVLMASKYELIYNARILLRIGLEFQRTNPFSALLACRSLRRNCWRSTKNTY